MCVHREQCFKQAAKDASAAKAAAAEKEAAKAAAAAAKASADKVQCDRAALAWARFSCSCLASCDD
jgi:hypothetical protein